MKSEVKEITPAKYPYIGIHETDGLIVLFCDEAEGVVIGKSSGGAYVGDYWRDLDEPAFKPFQGQVILSN